LLIYYINKLPEKQGIKQGTKITQLTIRDVTGYPYG
jgi:hypothetical protein